MSAATVQWTERLLLDRLRDRHSRVTGNGPHWAYMEHVRDGSGFQFTTTLDALALHLHPSRQHEAHGFEVKVSRSDFRRELANDCSKSASWRSWLEFFWIVAPADVVPLDELPDGWGLLVPSGLTLRAAVFPARLHPAAGARAPEPPLPRPVVAAMLRAQVANAVKVNGLWRRAAAEESEERP